MLRKKDVKQCYNKLIIGDFFVFLMKNGNVETTRYATTLCCGVKKRIKEKEEKESRKDNICCCRVHSLVGFELDWMKGIILF